MFLIRFAVVILLAVGLFSVNIASVKSYFFSIVNKKDQINRLELENDSLKASLYIAENLENKQIIDEKWEYLQAKVFSSYPFNNQNLISINLGASNNVENGSSVASAPGILLGQIIEIQKNVSLVRTIFDSNFTAAVKIGDNKISAFLKGGNPPVLEMIKKNSDIKTGDIVYNADQNFPFGFKIGEILLENKDTAQPFDRAFLKINYSPTALDEVLIIKNFEPFKKQ
jgi:cell shape-determining protein MreC